MASKPREPLDLDRRQLLERVREQEGVIRKLWDRYTHDVGHEPEVCDIAGRGARYIPAKTEAIRRALDQEQNFEDAVEEFDFQCTHSHAEATTQRVAATLMHGRRPAVVARRAGDVIFRGFWGRGVSMPAFERLLQKLRGLKHGSVRRIDFSDNGLNGNFVPGIIEILRRGVRQLDVSENTIESPAMQQLCSALPHIAQNLEVLDLRFNPCSDDPSFLFCLASVLPQMKFLDRLAVTMRCSKVNDAECRVPGRATSSRQHSRSVTPQHQQRGGGVRARRGRGSRRAMTPQHHRGASQQHGHEAASQRRRAATPQHCRQTASLDSHSWRVHSMSENKLPSQRSPRSGSPLSSRVVESATPFELAGADAVVQLLRAIAQCTQLRTLDLRSSLLSPAAAQRLSHVIRADNLVVLSLADCFLGDAVEPVLDAVLSCHQLVSLNLRLNAITGHAGIELCRALDASVSITEVDLASNELGDTFGEAFARVLGFNEVLRTVDLVRNPLGLRTGDALLRVLQRRNSTLVTIGDTVDGFFGLGLQNRYQIQCHLDANRRGLEVGEKPEETMDPGLADIEWRILDDEPPLFEPLFILG